MPHTLGELLQEQAGTITGREHERARLRRLLDATGPIVAYIHGLAGVGKTPLLHAFGADARAAGAETIELDGHVVYPTQGNFLAALTKEVTGSDPPGLTEAIAALPERAVIVIDTFEFLRPI